MILLLTYSPESERCFKYPQHACTMCRKFFRRTTNNICKSYHFYIFGRSGGCRIFWQSPLPDLQMLFDVVLKNFLDIFYTCCRHLKHSLGSGEHNALWFMIVSYFNQDISWQIWPHLTVDIFKSRIKKGRTKNATHFCVFWWICEIFWKLKKSKSSNIGQSNFWWYSDALKCRSGL